MHQYETMLDDTNVMRSRVPVELSGLLARSFCVCHSFLIWNASKKGLWKLKGDLMSHGKLKIKDVIG